MGFLCGINILDINKKYLTKFDILTNFFGYASFFCANSFTLSSKGNCERGLTVLTFYMLDKEQKLSYLFFTGTIFPESSSEKWFLSCGNLQTPMATEKAFDALSVICAQ